MARIEDKEDLTFAEQQALLKQQWEAERQAMGEDGDLPYRLEMAARALTAVHRSAQARSLADLAVKAAGEIRALREQAKPILGISDEPQDECGADPQQDEATAADGEQVTGTVEERADDAEPGEQDSGETADGDTLPPAAEGDTAGAVAKAIDDMDKDELEAYALERHGVNLDKRRSLSNLADQVKDLDAKKAAGE